MIQDTFYNLKPYRPHKPGPDDIIFSFQNKQVLVRKDRSFFETKDLSDSADYIYLFETGSLSFYLSDLSLTDHICLSLSDLRTYEPRWLGFAAVLAWQLYTWIDSNQYCGHDGHRMHMDKQERALRCDACGRLIYPTLSPAVIVGIIHDDCILVTRYSAQHSSYSHDALVAGYAEAGETIEETVRREVKEETGLDVEDIVYYRSQPWPFSSSLLFGFYCHVKGSHDIHLDQNELKMAVWKNRTDSIDTADDSSLTHEMIEVFQKGLVH